MPTKSVRVTLTLDYDEKLPWDDASIKSYIQRQLKTNPPEASVEASNVIIRHPGADMNFEERDELIKRLRNSPDGAKKLLWILNGFINGMGDNALHKAIEADLGDWHRTIQQCYMRHVIAPSITVFAKDDYPDDRNRDTVQCCKEIAPILEKYHFHFI